MNDRINSQNIITQGLKYPPSSGGMPVVSVHAMHYLMHGTLYIGLLLSILTSTENHPVSIIIYLLFCLVTLWSAITKRLSHTLNLLAVVVSYQSVTMSLFPFLRGYLFFILFLSFTCIILGMRFAKKINLFCYVLIFIAAFDGIRFLLTKSSEEFFAGAQFFSAAMIGMSLLTFPLRKREIIRIIETLCLSMTGVVLISLLAFTRATGELGWISYFLIDVGRLGNLDFRGANSFAYQSFVGYACGIVLLVHRRRQYLTWGAVLICGVAILLSKSLGTLLPAVVFPIVLYAIHSRRACVVAILMAFIAVFTVLPWALENDVVQNLLRLETRSMSRIMIWQECIETILRNPLWGVDHIEYSRNSILYTDYWEEYGGKIHWTVTTFTPHNIVLSYLVFHGIILGGILVLSKVYMLWRSYRESHTLTDSAMVLIPIFGFFIHLTIDMWFFIYLFVLALIAIPRYQWENKLYHFG